MASAPKTSGPDNSTTGEMMPNCCVARQLRPGIILLLAFEGMALAATLWSFPKPAIESLPFGLFNIVAGAICLALTWTTWFKHHWRITTLLLCSTVVVSASYLAVLIGRMEPLLISVILLMVGAGSLVPWEPRWQAALNLLCVSGLAIDGSFASPLGAGSFYGWLGLLAAVALAHYSASSGTRYRRELAAGVEELRRSQRRLDQEVGERDHIIAQCGETERRLAEKERTLRKTFEVSLDAMAISRFADHRFLDVNEELLRITGYRRDEVVGHSINDLHIWVHDEERLEYSRRIAADGSVRNLEHEFRTKSGEIRPGLISSIAVELGGEMCVVSVIREISEWKRTESKLLDGQQALSAQVEGLRASRQRLKESEEKLRKIFEASPDIITVRRLDTGRFTYVNREFTRLTGLSQEQALEKAIDDLQVWVDRTRRPEFNRLLREVGEVRNWEEDLRFPDGSIRTYLLSAVVVDFDGKPNVVALLRDVTRLKQTESDLLAAREALSAQVQALRESQLRLREEAEQRERVMAEREQAERRAQESETKLRKIFDASPDIISVRRLDTGRFTYVNREFTRLTGLSQEQALEKTVDDLRMWIDETRRQEFFRRLREAGQVRNWEEDFRLRDGSIHNFLISTVVVDFDGEPHAVGILHDITRLKHTESELLAAHEALSAQVQALRESQLRLREEAEQRERVMAEREQAERRAQESETKLRKVFDASPDGISVRRLRDDCFIEASREFVNLTGYKREEIIGSSIAALKLLVPSPALDRFYERLRAEGVVRSETNFRRKDGTIVPAMSSGVIVEIGGEACLVVITRDITQLKQSERELIAAREAAQAASRAKSEFLSSMSHEIRTPMNAILGMADLLWETQLSLHQRRYLETMRTSGDTLLDLINQILDLARVESGQLTLEETGFDLGELVEKTVETLGMRAHEKGLELAARIEPGVTRNWVGDPLRLRQILVNLLGNAIKFTPAGEVVLTVDKDPDPVRAGAPEAARQWLRFTVSDSGIGIAESKLQTIFSSFTQADSSITRRYGGTGLGLAIVKRLADLLGGEVSVESTLGKGSTFRFCVPMTVRTAPQTMVGRPQPELAGVRVLIADDHAVNRTVVREILGARGAFVKEAAHAEQAVRMVQEERDHGTPFDLVVLDGKMPGEDGFEAAARLRRPPSVNRSSAAPDPGAKPGQATVCPEQIVMMLTSDDLGSSLERLRGLGLANYLVKPLRSADLVEIAAAALGKLGPAMAPPIASDNLRPERCAQAPLRILLAEDSADNRLLIEAYLRSGRYQVETAENGEVAINKFIASKYDLVLMDIQMPLVDGYTATRAIRQWEQGQRREATPIIALTASAHDDAIHRSLEAGCDAHVSKPMKKDALLRIIDEYTNRRQVVSASACGGPALTAGSRRDGLSAGKLIVEVDDTLRDLMPGFLARKRDDAGTLQLAVQRGDFTVIASLGHQLRGEGGSYGLDALSEIGAALEAAAKRNDTAAAYGSAETLAGYLARLEIVYVPSASA